MSERAAIVVDDLTVRYGATVAVDHLSFRLPHGSITALLGPNGAGKTTTVETLEGFRRPSDGRVRVLGLDPVRDRARLVARVGVMLQEGGVYTGIRPPEVLRLFAAYYADPRDPDELLERVGLADRRTTTWRHLSGGEKQRLSLALALVGRPDLVFLDEPTSGIDPAGRRVIREVISSLRGDGTTVLLTTHDLAETERLADHIVIIDHGRLVASGSPEDLRSASGSEELRFSARPDLDVASLAAHLGAAVTETSPGEYRVDTSPSPDVVAGLTRWLADREVPLADLRAGRQSLEDVFLRLTDEGDAR